MRYQCLNGSGLLSLDPCLCLLCFVFLFDVVLCFFLFSFFSGSARSASVRSTPPLYSRSTRTGTRSGDATPSVVHVSAGESSSSVGFIVCGDLLALIQEDVRALQLSVTSCSISGKARHRVTDLENLKGGFWLVKIIKYN